MYLVPLAFVVGACLALFFGGNIQNVLRLRIALWPVLAGAAGLTILVAIDVDFDQPEILLAASLFAVGAACAVNVHLAGAGVVLIGVSLNLLALVLNGHIAVDPDAVVNAGIASTADLHAVALGIGRKFQTADTVIPSLGAVIPVRLVGEVFSFGDLVVMAGLANLGFRILSPRASPIPRLPASTVARRVLPQHPRENVIDLTDAASAPRIPQRQAATITGEAEHPPTPSS